MKYSILFFICITCLLSSCTRKVKEFVGVVTPGPNEYQVQPGKRLEIPPHYHLVEPENNAESKATTTNKLNKGDQALLKEIEY